MDDTLRFAIFGTNAVAQAGVPSIRCARLMCRLLLMNNANEAKPPNDADNML
jgi:hypothetical protein